RSRKAKARFAFSGSHLEADTARAEYVPDREWSLPWLAGADIAFGNGDSRRRDARSSWRSRTRSRRIRNRVRRGRRLVSASVPVRRGDEMEPHRRARRHLRGRNGDLDSEWVERPALTSPARVRTCGRSRARRAVGDRSRPGTRIRDRPHRGDTTERLGSTQLPPRTPRVPAPRGRRELPPRRP